MSKRLQKDILSDIKTAIERICLYIKDMTNDEFYKDIKTQDAVTRNIEIIGEAVKLLDENTKKMDISIEWSAMARTRDRLIHHYFGVDYDIIWAICAENLPNVLVKINKIINEIDDKN